MAKTVAVYPRDDLIRKFLRHPTGVAFDNYPDATLWPWDQFTMRRLREGSVAQTSPAAKEEPVPAKPAATPRRRGRQVMEK